MPAWFERFLQDLRHAIRLFAKSPGFTAICVLSIAFGTGANVAMFSVADALLLRPLPVSRPGELLRVGVPTRSGIFTNSVMSYADLADVRATSRSFEALTAYMLRRSGISAESGAAPIVKVVSLVSANFFDVLAIRPAIGRGFLPEEERVCAVRVTRDLMAKADERAANGTGDRRKPKFASEAFVGSVPLGRGPYTNGRIRQLVRERLTTSRERIAEFFRAIRPHPRAQRSRPPRTA